MAACTDADNQQKYLNYCEQMRRLKKALGNGFCLEVVFIEYAILEDRLESALTHVSTFNVSKQGPITAKIAKLEKLCECKAGLARKYFSDELLEHIRAWKDGRNPLVHKLMKQQLTTNELDAFALEGESLVKVLKNKVGCFNRAPDGDYQRILAHAAERRSHVWYRDFEVYYRAVTAAAHMQDMHRSCAGAIDAGTPKEIWNAYTTDLCSMDRWYREFNESLAAALKRSCYGLDDALKSCSASIEALYKNWFLRELSKRWLSACAEDLSAKGHANGIPLQLDFDMAEVGPLTRTSKRAWVIVSDALRYEVAQELGEVIQHETRCACELDAMQSVFPSITKCGMSALLPAGTFRMEQGADGLDVLVDGSVAAGTAARGKQLATQYPGAVAVQYSEFINQMTSSERKELVADAPLVYIYHNTIDAMGDKPISEAKTFEACRDAILELKALVERLVREQKASNIIITADHGFLYTAEPLDEHESASISNIDGEVVEYGRRHAVARTGATSQAFLEMTLPSDTLTGFCPRECVRIKMGGGGNNFAHGGFTLQECCVPVLRCSVKRKGARGYVETAPASISLITELGTITNGMFSVDILQDTPVGASTSPATYEVFVGDAAHTPITNIATVVADRTDEDARARTSHLQFTIKPGVDTDEQAMYALYARDVQTKQIQNLRPLKISIAFAPLDFGF